MKLQHLAAGAGALALTVIAPLPNADASAAPKAGSAHVQCDGQPNNVTSGETAARLLGAVTLLGLFAPAPEAPDASKRKFAEAGVAACTSLLSGDDQEGNAKRRLGLLLGRAIHQMEAKNYEAALADVEQARREAKAAGLTADPYFARSRGRSFDLVESAALLRLDRPDEARAASLRSAEALKYSLFGLFGTPTYSSFLTNVSPEEDRLLEWQSRLMPPAAELRAGRLEVAGRFAEAARVRDALVEFEAEYWPEARSSVSLASAAVAHALAGDAATAAERAEAARANADKRKADGKPEKNFAEYVELMDLYEILAAAAGGDAKTARRLFAARSQWVGASLGSVREVNRRLRQGATAEELIGGLAKDADQLWEEQASTARAALLAKDSDNKTLFNLVPGLRSAAAYEPLSKKVWRTEKSKLILKAKADSKNRMETLFLMPGDPVTAMEAYVLHTALLARSRGHEGFVFMPVFTQNLAAAMIRTGNRGEKGLPAELFIPADDVIASLTPLFPSPEALQARRDRR